MKFIPYVCCGDPTLAFTYKLVRALAPYSHIIELGIPFSDPMADGPTIQQAANRSLKNGANIKKIFSLAKKLRKGGVKVPFVFMTYYNIVLSYGTDRFLESMKQSGVQGIIIPDLPFGQDAEFEKLAKKCKISLIRLVAPNTPPAKMEKIFAKSGMFTYLVSVAGITGSRKSAGKASMDFVRRARKMAGKEKPLFVGFGVSNAAQARAFCAAGADGVIVGSHLIDIYAKSAKNGKPPSHAAIRKIELFASRISNA